MRIKTFRMFEKSDEPFFTDEEKIDIEDICQDLKDAGFNIKISSGNIMISKFNSDTEIYPSRPFTMTEDLFETIKRIEDYLDRAWFKVEVVLSGEMDSREIFMDESSNRVFFMSDKIYKGEKLIGSSSTEIKRLFIEI
jgi:hypothetical protein